MEKYNSEFFTPPGGLRAHSILLDDGTERFIIEGASSLQLGLKAPFPQAGGSIGEDGSFPFIHMHQQCMNTDGTRHFVASRYPGYKLVGVYRSSKALNEFLPPAIFIAVENVDEENR